MLIGWPHRCACCRYASNSPMRSGVLNSHVLDVPMYCLIRLVTGKPFPMISSALSWLAQWRVVGPGVSPAVAHTQYLKGVLFNLIMFGQGPKTVTTRMLLKCLIRLEGWV